VTGQTDHLDARFFSAAKLTVETMAREQHHENSAYRLRRFNCPASDTLSQDGLGSPVGYTGMSWSGFRPSDDSCSYHYLVPANMMAVVALEKLGTLPFGDVAPRARALALTNEIRNGIEERGKARHLGFGDIYAYEVDGLGHANLMDDANVPSLLAMPYMGYCKVDDPTYRATRAFVLSGGNPYYFAGKAARGIGSPHTPDQYIWPISLCMQGLTATSRDEQLAVLEILISTDAGTGLMHESFHKDHPKQFTRPWFAWANSLFAEFVMKVAGV
jgi:meiotically up-regulated gene 157 (Mug157) protein